MYNYNAHKKIKYNFAKEILHNFIMYQTDKYQHLILYKDDITLT